MLGARPGKLRVRVRIRVRLVRVSFRVGVRVRLARFRPAPWRRVPAWLPHPRSGPPPLRPVA